WVAFTESRADETRTLTITRYRLVEDTLGEAAVIVSMGIPHVEPRVAIDDDSHIYIAMPSSTTSDASVWRLLPDGTTPRTQSTPQFAAGLRVPMAMAVAPHGQLWLSGLNDAGLWQLRRVDSSDVDARFQSVAPARDDRQSTNSDITSFAFAAGARAGEPESSV